MLKVRPAKETDHRFILSTFLDSYKRSNYAGPVPFSDWWSVMLPVAEKLLLDNRVLVACHPDEDSTDADVYGWLAIRERSVPIVIYVYIKGVYRKMGLARHLFKAAGISPSGEWVYSASTKHAREIHKAGLIPNAIFEPNALRKDPWPTK